MLAVKRKLINIIRYMPEEKLNRLVKIADEMDDELTPEEIAAIKEGEAQIARGETISLSELRKRYDV
ncbi:MAG: hypothetical protein ABFC84_12610 [Veillonellales bacterium]